ncbi:uncharacterized protein LOC115889718 [Sitophilus oryzae]|uniref:Uncharacterized protein LOC115889718 n=1 Tax=Sitophilus oryzae TaxID=7048 RepID=A0A6J2YQV4_SITOR|nr:uncharacterized protein LOC115889718 [Sitophilus oryzae]
MPRKTSTSRYWRPPPENQGTGGAGNCTYCGKEKEENHDKTKNHMSAVKKLFCHFCGVQLSSDSDLQKHSDTEDHNIKVNKRHPNQTLFIMEGPEVQWNPEVELDLKLRKLVYNLYYSNTLRYEVSLEYLKYYQQEITLKEYWWLYKYIRIIFYKIVVPTRIDSPLLILLKEDLKLLHKREHTNNLRINVLNEMVSLISSLNKPKRMLPSTLQKDIIDLVKKWNNNFSKINKSLVCEE